MVVQIAGQRAKCLCRRFAAFDRKGLFSGVSLRKGLSEHDAVSFLT